MQIIPRKIDELVSAEDNPRQMTTEQRKSLTVSIKRFGLVDPILVNINPERKNIIVGGHQRVTIAKELGIEIQLQYTNIESNYLNVISA